MQTDTPTVDWIVVIHEIFVDRHLFTREKKASTCKLIYKLRMEWKYEFYLFILSYAWWHSQISVFCQSQENKNNYSQILVQLLVIPRSGKNNKNLFYRLYCFSPITNHNHFPFKAKAEVYGIWEHQQFRGHILCSCALWVLNEVLNW